MYFQNFSVIEMPSITHAMKAQRLLRSKGYICDIQRIAGNRTRGCSYNIRVNGNSDIITNILTDNHIMTARAKG